MTSFEISAPGKVILFGEHAVVYGKTAIASSLDLRTRLIFNELKNDTESDNFIHLDMPKLNYTCKVPINSLKHFFLKDECPKLNEAGYEKYCEYVQKFTNSIGIPSANQKISVECIIFALIHRLQTSKLELKPFKLYIDTVLSISSGLGSSASFSVCVTACFLCWSLLQIEPNKEISLTKEILNNISENAFNCEKIIHGNPSGIDNSICTFGSFIKFQKGKISDNMTFKVKNLKILLVDTKVDRSTKIQVQKLANLKEKHENIINPILEAMNEVSRSAIEILSKMSNDSDDEQYQLYKDLMLLIDINQGLLSTCQLSHPSLDSVCNISKQHNLSAKLTGAGGGGYAYILLPPNLSVNKINSVKAELSENGFSVTETCLGGVGVNFKVNPATSL